MYAHRVGRMKSLEVPPFAPALVESMRAVGYSLESALADVIDNSISAAARNIEIRFSPYNDPYVAVVDDGLGMTASELVEAMRHGSRNPNDVRTGMDLGRFGLGLKTASLSQARQLTVISRKNRTLSGARWDLDVIAETQRWTLLMLGPEDIKSIHFVDELSKKQHGTIVIWKHLDRLADAEGSVELGLREGMTRVRQHLSLVFHRFLSDEVRSARIALAMNLDPVQPVDPFLTWHPATQQLPMQHILINEADIVVQPYILPHYTKLTPDELSLAGGEEGLRRQQGFYIYRNRRLIIWGTWFRLARQEELTKLARVRVDIPNSLDSLWTLDIKKSAASPPLEVRRNLSSIIGRIADGSGRVYRFRGRRTSSDKFVHMWDRREGRHGVMYSVNREHPFFAAHLQSLDDLDRTAFSDLVATIEAMLPVEAIYADLAGDKGGIEQRPAYTVEQLADLAGRLLDAVGRETVARTNLLSQLSLLEPFSFYPEESMTIIQRLTNEH
jgi:hypothetical protein